MGKVIRAQRVGTSPRRRSPGHRFRADVIHPKFGVTEAYGKVLDIVHDPGRTAPLALVQFENNKKLYIVAPLGLKIGQQISYGKAEIKEGNISTIGGIPEGTLVYNVENIPGDGGKFARSGGTFCRIVTHDQRGTVVQLPSGTFKTVDSKCRAAVGIVAGSGRHEKPFMKAGPHFHAMSARNRLWPVVKGVNMNPVDHPFGGGGHPHTGKPKTVARSAPPGRKIGSIAARRTGKQR